MRPPVGLDEADDDVGAAGDAPVALLEHPVGLADARAPCRGRRAAGRAPLGVFGPDAREHLVRRWADVEARRAPGSVIVLTAGARPGRG